MRIIYGQSDVARELGVSRANVSNWLNRPVDPPIPEPAYRTPGGTPFWSDLAVWVAWWDKWR